MIKGVIMDMDGLMIDTEKLYMRFWREAAKIHGYEMSEEMVLSIRSMAAKYAVKKFHEFFGEDCDYYGIRNTRRIIMEEYIDINGIEMKEGLIELLNYLKDKKYLIAVATATDIERSIKYLKMFGIDKYYQNIVTASMVKSGKPMPDIYIEAAYRLGLKTNECLALEDSPNGVLSAYRAGCRVVMIPDLDEPNDEIKKKVFTVAKNLKKVIEVLELKEC